MLAEFWYATVEFFRSLVFWHQMGFWRTTGIVVAAVGQTLFVMLYLTFPWWRNFLGRALFGKGVAFALLLDAAVLGRVWDWPNEELTFIVLYWIVGLGIWWQAAAFLRVRLAGTHDQVSGNPEAKAHAFEMRQAAEE